MPTITPPVSFPELNTLKGSNVRTTLQAQIDALVGTSSPGGLDGQLQYNAAGAFGGVAPATFNGTIVTITDSGLRIADNIDPTKLVRFELNALTSGNTRTLQIQDESGYIAIGGHGIVHPVDPSNTYVYDAITPDLSAGAEDNTSYGYTLMVGLIDGVGNTTFGSNIFTAISTDDFNSGFGYNLGNFASGFSAATCLGTYHFIAAEGNLISTTSVGFSLGTTIENSTQNVLLMGVNVMNGQSYSALANCIAIGNFIGSGITSLQDTFNLFMGQSIIFDNGSDFTGVRNMIISTNFGNSEEVTKTFSYGCVLGESSCGGITTARGFCIIGQGTGVSVVANENFILLGRGADVSTSSSTNEMCVGSDNYSILNYFWGRGGQLATSGADVIFQLGGTAGTNIAGGNFYHKSQIGTGTGGSGKHIFQTAPSGSTGATPNTLADAFAIDKNGNLESPRLHNNISTKGVGQIRSGTYTPTLTSVANVSASTARLCTWKQVGNTISVSGQLDIDPTTTLTLTQLGISLPVASALTTAFQLGGTGISKTNNVGTIEGDATNDRAQLAFSSAVDVTNQTVTFIFQYEVL